MKNVPSFGFVAGQWLSFKRTMPDGEEIVRTSLSPSPPDSDSKVQITTV